MVSSSGYENPDHTASYYKHDDKCRRHEAPLWTCLFAGGFYRLPSGVGDWLWASRLIIQHADGLLRATFESGKNPCIIHPHTVLTVSGVESNRVTRSLLPGCVWNGRRPDLSFCSELADRPEAKWFLQALPAIANLSNNQFWVLGLGFLDRQSKRLSPLSSWQGEFHLDWDASGV